MDNKVLFFDENGLTDEDAFINEFIRLVHEEMPGVSQIVFNSV